MNRKHLFAAAFTAFAVLACAKQEIVPEPEYTEPVDQWTFVPEKSFFVGNGNLTVSAEYGSETKSQLVSDGAGASVLWTAGDLILMMNEEGQYTSFTASASGAKVDFSGGATLPASDVFHCFYPFSAFKERVANIDSRPFRMKIPDEQAATIGSVAEGANLSYARSSSQSDPLHFQNFVSLIKFRLSGDIVSSVKKVKILGTQSMSGYIILKPDAEGAPTVLRGQTPSAEYEDYAHASLIGDFEAGKDYYIAVAPGVHSGFSMIFYNGDGTKSIKKVSSKELVLDRSRIKNFGTISLGSAWDAPSTAPLLYIEHTVQEYATIAVIPDGYTAEELDQYELDAKAGIDALFNTEPYKSYRGYFNVWILKVASNESGARITDGTLAEQRRDCYFQSSWGSGKNYGNMTANDNKVFDFVEANCPDLVDGTHVIQDVPILLIINDERYGGKAMNISNGKTYCMVPKTAGSLSWSYPVEEASSVSSTPWDKRTVTLDERNALGKSTGSWHNTLVHEFGGHSIGRLGDEYWYPQNEVNECAELGSDVQGQSWAVPFGRNVSATSDPAQVPWKDLLLSVVGKSPYEERIGVFQGADVSMFNRWRSEKVSCMIDNRFYFSTWQRYLIVNRIMALAGRSARNLSQFLYFDKPEDPLRDIISSPVKLPDGVTQLPPRPVPMLPPPVYVP